MNDLTTIEPERVTVAVPVSLLDEAHRLRARIKEEVAWTEGDAEKHLLDALRMADLVIGRLAAAHNGQRHY